MEVTFKTGNGVVSEGAEAQPKNVAAPEQTGPADGTSQATTSEGSLRGQLVALMTPVLAAAAALVAGWVSKHVGVDLDKGQVTAFMVAVVGTVLGMGLKWLHGWQLHEQRVALGTAEPVKPAQPAR